MKRVAGLALCVASFLTTAASADSGYVAHPDLAGTQTLSVTGSVERYDMRGGRVTLLTRNGACRRVTWVPGEKTCIGRGSVRWPDRTSHRRPQRRHWGRAPAGRPRPSRSAARHRRGRKPEAWPLPERAFHVDVDGGTAIFSTRGSREVYAVDLRSGRVALVALTRQPGDAAAGCERSPLSRQRLQAPRERSVHVDEVHTAASYRSGTTSGSAGLCVSGERSRISPWTGSRVALAVRRWQGGCDAVIYWNTPWNYSIPITEADERTCAWSRQGGTIQSVSLAGLRAAWVVRVRPLSGAVGVRQQRGLLRTESRHCPHRDRRPPRRRRRRRGPFSSRIWSAGRVATSSES